MRRAVITPAVTGYLHRVVAQRPHGPGVPRFGEDQIRPFTHKSGGVRAEVDVCFAIKATWLLRSSDTTRWAKLGNGSRRKIALHCDRHIFYSILTDFLPDVLKSILVEKTREAAKCYRHQSLIASTVVAGSAFTLGASRLSQS
jgi:hypothetical protein